MSSRVRAQAGPSSRATGSSSTTIRAGNSASISSSTKTREPALEPRAEVRLVQSTQQESTAAPAPELSLFLPPTHKAPNPPPVAAHETQPVSPPEPVFLVCNISFSLLSNQHVRDPLHPRQPGHQKSEKGQSALLIPSAPHSDLSGPDSTRTALTRGPLWAVRAAGPSLRRKTAQPPDHQAQRSAASLAAVGVESGLKETRAPEQLTGGPGGRLRPGEPLAAGDAHAL
ncbi:unnamed protein product [Rangifer tarandus platyrhynchus]|uniref:Uncharacterized protein n=1 Tax=Rangifer tarandus platyrhynchus TaxID=3082113 RepID=A0AC59ZVD3_RANTA